MAIHAADSMDDSKQDSPVSGNNKPVHDPEKKLNDPEGAKGSQPTQYLTGWRLHCTFAGVLAAMFLAMMEASIVTTALIGITNDLEDFSISSWIVNAYLVTFTSFILVWVQFSFVLGRRSLLIAAFAIFIAFSGACAGASTAIQLVIFRALQGIGGAGASNIATVIIAEAVPPEETPKYVAIIATIYVLAFGLGPLIGGAIVSNTTWRWIFWINIPAAAVTLLLLTLSIPRGFPHHNDRAWKRDLSRVKKLDLLGGLLFLAGALLLTTAFQGADISWSWSSATSICLLVFSIIALLAFAFWQWFITSYKSVVVPLMTWKFAKRRTMALFAIYCLTSFPFTSSNVGLTERFQIIDGLSPFDAGVRLLPFICIVPVWSILGVGIVDRFKIKHAYAMLVGVVLQLIGVICFVTANPDVRNGPARVVYGYEVILGTGLGINNGLVQTIIPHIVEKPLVATTVGTGFQFRYLGNVLGFGVLTAVFDSRLRSGLSDILSSDQLAMVLQSPAVVASFPAELQGPVQEVFVQGFQNQWKTLLGFVAVQIPIILALL